MLRQKIINGLAGSMYFTSPASSGYLFRVLLAIVTGGGLGGLLAGVTFGMGENSASLGVGFGIPIGSITALLFYTLAYWFVFRIPPERVAKFLIGGTLLGSVPLALIPKYGGILSFVGGVIGYWLGFTELLIRRWRENHSQTRE